MIRRRLEELTIEALLQVATFNGLSPEPEGDRDALIDELVEVIRENREERASENSVTVRIQQAKYELIGDEAGPLLSPFLDGIDLPDHYETTRIVLMLRDPRWAYTYWDLSSAKVREYQASGRFDGLALRVLEIDSDDDELHIIDSFEVPIKLTDRSWYIYLPRQRTSYRIQLVARNNHRRELLAVSNRVYVPMDRFERSADQLTPREMAIHELCGLEYLEVPPWGDERPQRVVGA